MCRRIWSNGLAFLTFFYFNQVGKYWISIFHLRRHDACMANLSSRIAASLGQYEIVWLVGCHLITTHSWCMRICYRPWQRDCFICLIVVFTLLLIYFVQTRHLVGLMHLWRVQVHFLLNYPTLTLNIGYGAFLSMLLYRRRHRSQSCMTSLRIIQMCGWGAYLIASNTRFCLTDISSRILLDILFALELDMIRKRSSTRKPFKDRSHIFAPSI